MAAAEHSFVAHVADLLASSGTVTARRMFGGHGVYLDGLFIGIIADDVFYLKTDAQTEHEFRAAGSSPFSYRRRGNIATLRFWSAPDDAMESPRLMQPWARQAIAASLRAKKTGRTRRPEFHKTTG